MNNLENLIAFFVFYGAVKLVAYSAWCYGALCWFPNKAQSKFKTASLFGTIRLFIGIVLGFILTPIFLLSMLQTHSQFLFYLLFFFPVRIIEWGLLWVIMHYSPIKLFANNKKHITLWILGGILVSFFADFPIPLISHFFGFSFPSGRIFC